MTLLSLPVAKALNWRHAAARSVIFPVERDRHTWGDGLGIWIVAIVVAGALAWGVGAFNRLVRLRNQTRTAWADIDVQLTRRHDLVPQLVAVVQGYAGHEKAVLEVVTELRARAVQQSSPTRLGEVESELETALGRLFALQEAYPDLKASDNFLQLQRDLVAVEEHLQFARRFYNGAVRDYNDAVQRVPDVFVAQAFAFRAGEFYQAQDGERAAIQVKLP
jgi:LemA protein